MSFYTEMSFYGVVPKGLLTSLGSLYKEVATTTLGTLVYRFERQTARKRKIPPSNNIVSSTKNVGFYLRNVGFYLRNVGFYLRNVGFYLRNLQIASFCILMSYFMENKLKKI